VTPTAESTQNSELRRATLSAHALESLGNYQSADEPLESDISALPGDASVDDRFYYYDDREFWQSFAGINEHETRAINTAEIEIMYAAVSEWVARVPGLYWSEASETFRKIKPENIESRTGNWVTYSPAGKSQKVTGGIGTVKLPPSETGYRLVGLTTSHNASSGAPALVSPEVWEYLNLEEGVVIHGNAQVRPMPAAWAREFPSIKGIPRFCIVLDNVDALQVTEQSASILIHPFTVMEYWENDVQLLDFVYAATDSIDAGYRGDLEQFFDRYKDLNGREGNYLIAADIAQPMWDAKFTSPADMRNQTELNIIEQRVQDNLKGESVIAPLLAQLNSASDKELFKKISDLAGLRHQQWFKNGAQADEASNLVGAAVESTKVAELVQATHQVLD